MLHQQQFTAFAREMAKVAALSPKQEEVFAEVRRRANDFDRQAGSGNMDEATKVKHRHNTERMQHLLKKKRDDAHSLPKWVEDLKAAPPEETVHRAQHQEGRRGAHWGADWGGFGDAIHADARRVRAQADNVVNMGTIGGIVGGTAGAYVGRKMRTDTEGNPVGGLRGFVGHAAPYVGTVGGAVLGGMAGHRMPVHA